MTATQAGQPAKDPDDGAHGGADVDGTAATDADQADVDQHGAARTSATRLTYDDDDRAGSGTAERIAALRARLMTPMPDDGLWGWIGPLLVTAFAAFMRFNRLSVPNAVIFDETYYAKDAWSILKHGVEWNMLPNPSNNSNWLNNLIIAGHTNIFQACSGTGCGEYVVQPPLGKLVMAVGEWLFGLTTLGWRVAPALFGTLAVLVMCRVARRLTRSTLLGCTAGLLLSLDGLEFVLSRTGILDIFLMFFVLAAFGALVVDRDVSRGRLAEAMVLQPGDEARPAARHQEVARRGGHPHRPRLRVQAIRRLVHPRLRRAVHRLGHRRAAHRRAARLRARRAGAGRQVAAAHPRRDPAGYLHPHLDGVDGHQHRVRPGLRAAARDRTSRSSPSCTRCSCTTGKWSSSGSASTRGTRTCPSRGTGS